MPQTIDVLAALFAWYGPLLVIKCDNDVGRLLEKNGVLCLLSPPRTLEYNGACEAGIGSIKLRAHLESARHDRPGQWTCDDRAQPGFDRGGVKDSLLCGGITLAVREAAFLLRPSGYGGQAGRRPCGMVQR